MTSSPKWSELKTQLQASRQRQRYSQFRKTCSKHHTLLPGLEAGTQELSEPHFLAFLSNTPTQVLLLPVASVRRPST